MTETATGSDKSIGLGLLFAIVAVVGAGGMLLGAFSHNQVFAGLGFGLAVLAASIAVAAIQVYA